MQQMLALGVNIYEMYVQSKSVVINVVINFCTFEKYYTYCVQ